MNKIKDIGIEVGRVLDLSLGNSSFNRIYDVSNEGYNRVAQVQVINQETITTNLNQRHLSSLDNIYSFISQFRDIVISYIKEILNSYLGAPGLK